MDKLRTKKHMGIMRVLSMILTVALFVTGIPSLGTVSRAEQAPGKVFDVTDYDVNAAGGTDASIGVYKAIAAAKEYQEKNPGAAVEIRFPKGRYDFYPDMVEGRVLYPSNTNNGGIGNNQGNMNGANESASWYTKYIGILIEDMKNVTVNGDGSTFMYHGNMTPFASINSDNVVFKNFISDFQAPLTVDFTVLDVNRENNTAKIKVPECYDVTVSGTNLVVSSDKSPYNNKPYYSRTFSGISRGPFCKVLDSTDNVWLDNGVNLLGSRTSVTALTSEGKNIFQINYSSLDSRIREGLIFQVREDPRRTPGTFIWLSNNVVLEDIQYYYMHGFGIVAQQSKDLEFNDITFGAPKETGRAAGGFADFMQISGCGGTVKVDGCVFQNPQDDPINMHGTYNDLLSIDSANRKKIVVRFRHGETFGFPNFFPGDQVEFCAEGSVKPYNKNGQQTEATDDATVFRPRVVEATGPDGNGGLCTMRIKDDVYANGQWKKTPDQITRDDYTIETLREKPALGGNETNRKITLILDQNMPTIPVNGDNDGTKNTRIENISYIPDIEISNCVFKESGPRAILLKARKSINVHDNLFDGIESFNIEIEKPANGNGCWMESGRVLDMQIKNNVFMRGPWNGNPILEFQSNSDNLHKNIVVEGNEFYLGGNGTQTNKPYKVVNVNGGGIDGLTIKDNKFLWLESNVQVYFGSDKEQNEEKNIAVNAKSKISTTDLSDVKLNISGKKITGNDDLFSLGNSRKVVFENNTYDGGVNARANISNQANVEKRNDIVGLNANNKIEIGDQVYYVSSRPDVVSVSDKGEVTALKDGVAEITAYVISGGRKYQSLNTLTYIVGEGAAIDAPFVVENAEELITEEKSVVTYKAKELQDAEETVDLDSLEWTLKDATDDSADVAFATINKNTVTGNGNGVALVSASLPETNAARNKIATVLMNKNAAVNGAFSIANAAAQDNVTANADGSITMKPSNGDVYTSANNVQSLLSTPFDTTGINPSSDDWRLEVTVDGVPSGGLYQFAGLIVYSNMDNYIMARRQNRPNSGNVDWISNCVEVNGVDPRDNNHKVQYNDNDLPTTITLGIEKTENTAKVYYVTGNDRQYADALTISDNKVSQVLNGNALRLGVIAGGGVSDARFTFSNLNITKLNVEESEVVVRTITVEEPVVEEAQETEEVVAENLEEVEAEGEDGVEAQEVEEAEAEPVVATETRTIEETETIVKLVEGEAKVIQLVENVSMTEKPEAGLVTVEQGVATISPVQEESIVRWAISDTPAVDKAPKDYSILLGRIGSTTELNDWDFVGKYLTAAVIAVKNGVPSEITWSGSVKIAEEDIVVDGKGYELPEALKQYKSSNAYLEDMTIKIGDKDITAELKQGTTTADKGFAEKIYSYNYYISNSSSNNKLEFELVPADENAEVSVLLRKADVEVSENDGILTNSENLQLTNGANIIEFKVEAEDGVTSRIYRVNLNRKGNDEARLQSLVVNGNNLITGANDSAREFVASVTGDANTLSVNAVAASGSADVKISGDRGLANAGQVKLKSGENKVTVVVTPETGGRPEIYTIKVYAITKDNTDLAEIKVTDGTLDQEVAVDKTAYSASVYKKSTVVTVKTLDEKATVKIKAAGKETTGTGSVDAEVKLSLEEKTPVEIIVTSQDGTQSKTYTLDIEARNYIYLSDLEFEKNAMYSDAPWLDRGNSTSKIGIIKAGSNAPNNGVDEYDKGLVLHPNAGNSWCTATFYLDELPYKFTKFTAIVGVEASVKSNLNDSPGAVFAVDVDGVSKPVFANNATEYEALIQRSGSYNGPAKIELDLDSDVSTLTIKAKKNSNNWSAHAAYADAKLYFDLDEQAVVNEDFIYLSDVDWTARRNSLGGTPIRDQSWNGAKMGVVKQGTAPADGFIPYDKGLFMHPDGTAKWSEVDYDLDALGEDFTRFTAVIGIAPSANKTDQTPTVVFRVLLDGKEIDIDDDTEGNYYKASIQSNGTSTGPKELNIDISQAHKLTIGVTRMENNQSVHGAWADAKLYMIAAEKKEISDLTMWYKAPAGNQGINATTYKSNATNMNDEYNTWQRYSLPIGNGKIGANIFGRTRTERIILTEETFWSGGPKTSVKDDKNNVKSSQNSRAFGNIENYGNNGQRMLDIKTKFRNNEDPTSLAGFTDGQPGLVGPTDGKGNQGYGFQLAYANMFLEFEHTSYSQYSRGLDLNEAVSYVDYVYKDTKFHRDYFANNPSNVVVTRLQADGDEKLNFKLMMKPDPITTGSVGHNNDNGKQRTYTVNVSNKGSEVVAGSIDIQGTVSDNDLKFASKTVVLLKDGEGNVKVLNNANGVEESGSWTKSNVQDDTGGQLEISNAKEVVIITSIGTNYEMTYPDYRKKNSSGQFESESDVFARVSEKVLAAANKGYDALYEEHVKDYQGLFNRLDLDFGGSTSKATDVLLTAYKGGRATTEEKNHLEVLLYQYGRYMSIASSRANSQLPNNLQGIWVAGNNSPWHTDFHLNVNEQMNYWPVYASNLAENAKPLINFVDKLREPGRVTARVYAGISSDASVKRIGSEGTKLADYTDTPWDDLEVTVAEEGSRAIGNGFMAHTQNTPFGWTTPGWNFKWGWSPAAIPWILQNCWEYYEYTKDYEYMRDYIFPMMWEECRLYVQMLDKRDDGKGGYYYISTPAYSPEHGPMTDGNTYEQTLIWQLFNDSIIAANEILSKETSLLRKYYGHVNTDTLREEVAQWEEIKAHLYGPVEIGKSGQIKEWFIEETFTEGTGGNAFDKNGNKISGSTGYQQRHLSHMLGLYPGDLISVETPKLFEAAKWSMQHRTDDSQGWSIGQRIVSWARLRDGEKSHQIMSNYLFGKKIFPNLWDWHGDMGGLQDKAVFQIDGNFGYTAAVNEMLMQSNLGYIDLLPALPEQWSEGSIEGLVARGNFVLDMSWSDSSLSTVKVTSKAGGDCTIQFAGAANAQIEGVSADRITKDGNKITIKNTSANEVFTVKNF